MGRNGFPVHATTAVAGVTETRVTVQHELRVFQLPGMVLRSSADRAPNIQPNRWPPALHWMVQDRLKKSGVRKGRVLAIWQNEIVVAACAWHLEDSGPLEIFDLGCRGDLAIKDAKWARAALLFCLRDIAEHRNVGRNPNLLRWSHLPLKHHPGSRTEIEAFRGEIRARADAMKFVKIKNVPQRLKGEWARERAF